MPIPPPRLSASGGSSVTATGYPAVGDAVIAALAFSAPPRQPPETRREAERAQLEGIKADLSVEACIFGNKVKEVLGTLELADLSSAAPIPRRHVSMCFPRMPAP